VRSSERISVQLATDTADPAPYIGKLVTLSVKPDLGKVLIVREEQELLISGAPEARAVLADNVQTLAETPDDVAGHVHLDPTPDHPYLREGSLSLVLAHRLPKN
jgi:hypothetical protein